MKILIFYGIITVINLWAIIFVQVPCVIHYHDRIFSWVLLGIQLAGLGAACLLLGFTLATF